MAFLSIFVGALSFFCVGDVVRCIWGRRTTEAGRILDFFGGFRFVRGGQRSVFFRRNCEEVRHACAV